MFGARYEFAQTGRVRPFVEGGFGFARLKVDFTIELDGVEIEDDDFVGFEADTEPAYALGGGVAIPIGPNVSAEAGYRFFRILTGEAINANKFYGGVRVTF